MTRLFVALSFAVLFSMLLGCSGDGSRRWSLFGCNDPVVMPAQCGCEGVLHDPVYANSFPTDGQIVPGTMQTLPGPVIEQ